MSRCPQGAILSLSVLALIAAPAAAPAAPPSADTQAAHAALFAAPADCAPSGVEPLGGSAAEGVLSAALPEPEEAGGCTAQAYCIHGGSVFCSAPTGTCVSSGAGCGYVSCNGQAQWCPGRCYGDHHCASFCNWAPNSYCDEFGCCVCED